MDDSSVSLSVMWMGCAKTTEPVDVLFRVETVVPKKHSIRRGVPIPELFLYVLVVFLQYLGCLSQFFRTFVVYFAVTVSAVVCLERLDRSRVLSGM